MKSNIASRKLQLIVTMLSLALAFLPSVRAQQPDGRLLTVQEVKQLPAKAKRFALVIGVDEYQDSQINRLSGATNDAKSLANALVRYAGFPSDQVILLASDQPQERQPNRGNILQYLSNLRGVVPEDGLLLVSFAGHGIERSGRGFLCPSDARIGGSITLLESTAIAVDTVREWIRDTGVKQVLIILDACRNDPSGRGDQQNKLTDSFAKNFNFDIRNHEVTAFATLYATDVGHVAYEYKEKKQGYFTYLLIEGLKGGAANERGEVTLGSLVTYLQEQVPKRIRLDLGQEKSQKPYAIVGGYRADELVISISARIAPDKSATIDVGANEREFWSSIKGSSDPEDFKAYIQAFPNGLFVTLARNRLNSLEIARKSEITPASNSSSVPPTSSGSALPPPVDNILDQYVRAIGGKTAFEKLTSRVSKGTFEMSANGVNASIEAYQKAPNRGVIIIHSSNGGIMQQGFNGTIAWSMDPQDGLRELSGTARDSHSRNAEFYYDIRLKEIYPTRVLEGKTRIDDREVNIVKVTPLNGMAELMYFDTETGLLLRHDHEDDSPKGKLLVETYYGDYREIDGVKIPFFTRSKSTDSEYIVKLSQVQHNVYIEDTKFDKPSTQSQTTLNFNQTEYRHRWSQNGQHEFTPSGQDDLAKWTDMVTINFYPQAMDGDSLALVANQVLENYKSHQGKVLRTVSVPRTSDKPSEHLIVVVFGRPAFLEAVQARFKLVNGNGVAIIYSHRVYGKAAGPEMSTWLKDYGPSTEMALMVWAFPASLGSLQKSSTPKSQPRH